jgi:hypothetical protein
MKLNIHQIQDFFNVEILDIKASNEQCGKHFSFNSYSLRYEIYILYKENCVSIRIIPEAFKAPEYETLASTITCDEIKYYGPDQHGTDCLHFFNTDKNTTHMTISRTNDKKFQISIGCI